MAPSPNGRWEVESWYLFEFGTSAYFAPALVLLIPLLQERLATQVACESLPDGCNSKGDPISPDAGKRIKVGFISMDPTALTFAILGVSVLLQFLAFMSFSAAADYGRYRKKLLFTFSNGGAITTILFVACVQPRMWLPAAILTILTNVFLGLAYVFFNSYLPDLVHGHPDYLAEYRQLEGRENGGEEGRVPPGSNSQLMPTGDESQAEQPGVDSDSLPLVPQGLDGVQRFNIEGLGPSLEHAAKLNGVEDRVSNQLSTRSVTAGFVCNIIVTLLAFLILVFYPQSDSYDDQRVNFALALSVALCGAWWLVFTYISMAGLREHEGPPFPKGKSLILFSWQRQWATLQQARSYPNLFLFLIAFFFYSDGNNTIMSCAVLYASTELNISEGILGIALLEVLVVAVIGNSCTLALQEWLQIGTKSMVIFLVVAVGVLGFCGFFLTSVTGVLVFAAVYGVFLGPLNSYGRSLYAQMIPYGQESRFFGLQQVFDKGSSWSGPVVLAVITEYNSAKYGFLYVAGVMFVAVPIFLKVNIKEGRRQRGGLTVQASI